MSPYEQKRGQIISETVEFLLPLGKKYGLDTIELLDVVAKVQGALTEAALKTKGIVRSAGNMMTPLDAAKISSINVSIGTPDEDRPELYFFRGSDHQYFWVLGSQIKKSKIGEVPFCTWAPAPTDSPAAARILEKTLQ